MRSRLDARLAKLEALDPEQAWRFSEGLAAILAHARQYPAETCDLDEVLDDEELVGLAKLLWEAREWRAEGRH